MKNKHSSDVQAPTTQLQSLSLLIRQIIAEITEANVMNKAAVSDLFKFD